MISAGLGAFPVCLTPPVPGGPQDWRLQPLAGMSLPLSPHGNSSPLPLSSPIDVSSLHIAQAAGLRAAQQEHVGLEEQKGGESTWLRPSLPKLPPTAPGVQPALGHHSPGQSSPYAAGRCPRRRCRAISASRSCGRIRGGHFYPCKAMRMGALAVSVLWTSLCLSQLLA